MFFWVANHPTAQLAKLNLLKKIKEKGVFKKHTHQPPREGGASVSCATDREAIGPFFLDLLPMNLNLPDPAQNILRKPKGAVRGVPAPPPKWRIGGVSSIVVFTVGRSM